MFKKKSMLGKIGVSIFVTIVGLYGLTALSLLIISNLAVEEGANMESTRGEFKSNHTFYILDRGVDSLMERVKLIRSAQDTIEMEFFIFDLDQTSRLLMKELIQKASEGVKVRILVDFSKPIFRLSPAYVKFLSQSGIQVRYYNTAPIYRIASIQHRTHRKLLVVDDSKVIVGGRNIADEYFDMDPKYNFLDSDVLVEGEVAKFVRIGFDDYFDSKLTSKPSQDQVDKKHYEKTIAFFEDNKAYQTTLETLETYANKNLQGFPCEDVIFVTDPPSAAEEHHKIFNELASLAKDIDSEVILESPYFILGPGGVDLFNGLHEKGVKLRVTTNSLRSSDATYVISAMAAKLSTILEIKMDLFLMNGNSLTSQSLLNQSTRWGLHAKRGVIDKKHTIVGTYNIDPRSANLNSELMIVCKNAPSLAAAVLSSMDERLKVAQPLVLDGEFQSYKNLYSGASTKTQFLMLLMMPLSSMFQFLL